MLDASTTNIESSVQTLQDNYENNIKAAIENAITKLDSEVKEHNRTIEAANTNNAIAIKDCG